MKRPYVICHMVQSIDGKVTGDFLAAPACAAATELYYEINRGYKADAFACGRVTMESSFTGEWYPDLSQYPAVTVGEDYVVEKTGAFYAVAFDRRGSLGWKSALIEDDDPGYGGAQILEVLTEDVDPRYVGYLRSIGASYLFAGARELDLPLALSKLRALFAIETLLLEGGSIINGAFEREDLIDEWSLVVAPVLAGGEDKPLCMNSVSRAVVLLEATVHDGGVLRLRYGKTRTEGETR